MLALSRQDLQVRLLDGGFFGTGIAGHSLRQAGNHARPQGMCPKASAIVPPDKIFSRRAEAGLGRFWPWELHSQRICRVATTRFSTGLTTRMSFDRSFSNTIIRSGSACGNRWNILWTNTSGMKRADRIGK
jgi:hypothetical protein